MKIQVSDSDAMRLRKITINGKPCGAADIGLARVIELLKDVAAVAELKERVRHNAKLKDVLQKELDERKLTRDVDVENFKKSADSQLKKLKLKLDMLELEVAHETKKIGDEEYKVFRSNLVIASSEQEIIDLTAHLPKFVYASENAVKNITDSLDEEERVKKAQLERVAAEIAICNDKIKVLEDFNG